MVDYSQLWCSGYRTKTRLYMMPYIASGVIMDTKPGRRVPVNVIDWGCGLGQSSDVFKKNGIAVKAMVDIADTAFCEEARQNHICIVDDVRTARLGFTSDYGYCSDVLEHLCVDDIDPAIETIKLHSHYGMFIAVTSKEDEYEGKELHLTVKDVRWWLDKMSQHGTILVAGTSYPHSTHFFFVGVDHGNRC